MDSAFDKTMLLSLNTLLKVHNLGKENLYSTNIGVYIVSLEGSGHKNFILIEDFMYVRTTDTLLSSSHVKQN